MWQSDTGEAEPIERLCFAGELDDRLWFVFESPWQWEPPDVKKKRKKDCPAYVAYKQAIQRGPLRREPLTFALVHQLRSQLPHSHHSFLSVSSVPNIISVLSFTSVPAINSNSRTSMKSLQEGRRLEVGLGRADGEADPVSLTQMSAREAPVPVLAQCDHSPICAQRSDSFLAALRKPIPRHSDP